MQHLPFVTLLSWLIVDLMFCSGELCWALLFSGLIQQWPSRLDLVLRVGGSVYFSLSSCFCKYWMAVKYKTELLFQSEPFRAMWFVFIRWRSQSSDP